MLKSHANVQKYHYCTLCETVENKSGLSMCFSDASNVTISLPDAAVLFRNLLEQLGCSSIEFVKLKKKVLGARTIGPPANGVGVAQMNCPFLQDNKVTLNVLSLDGDVVDVRLCRNGQERDQFYLEARKRI